MMVILRRKQRDQRQGRHIAAPGGSQGRAPLMTMENRGALGGVDRFNEEYG